MCLCRIDHRETGKLNLSGIQVAYKVFRVVGGSLYNLYPKISDTYFPPGDWLENVEHHPHYVEGKRGMSYHVGFHAGTLDYAVWLKANAHSVRVAYCLRHPGEPMRVYAVHRVELKNVTTVGRQWANRRTYRAWVAQSIRVLERIGEVL